MSIKLDHLGYPQLCISRESGSILDSITYEEISNSCPISIQDINGIVCTVNPIEIYKKIFNVPHPSIIVDKVLYVAIEINKPTINNFPDNRYRNISAFANSQQYRVV